MWGLLAATETPIFPSVPPGNPGCVEIFDQCAPPSVVLYRPLPGPPLVSFHGTRCACHIAAYSSLGSRGFIARSTAPVPSSTKRILRHDLPPSTVLKTPRSALGLKTCPIDAA